MSSRVAFRPRRIYAFGFAKHRSLPLAALRVRMTSHERNEFVGTTPTTQTLVISSEARNLLLTTNWRSCRFLVARLLETTRRRFEVGSRGSSPNFPGKKKGAGSACTLLAVKTAHQLNMKLATPYDAKPVIVSTGVKQPFEPLLVCKLNW